MARRWAIYDREQDRMYNQTVHDNDREPTDFIFDNQLDHLVVVCLGDVAPDEDEKPVEELSERDNDFLQNVLLLVDIDVPLEDIQIWSDEDCMLVQRWAGLTHVRANDNDDVVVPPKPEFLNKYPPADEISKSNWKGPNE